MSGSFPASGMSFQSAIYSSLIPYIRIPYIKEIVHSHFKCRSEKKSSNRIAPLLSKIAHSCGQREEAWENTAQTPGIIILENESMGTDENIGTGLSLPTVHSSLSSLYIDKERF